MQFESIPSKRSISLAAALSLGLAAFAFTGCGDEAAGPASTGLITLTSPQGGETFKVGETLHIKWTVKDDPEAPTAVDPMISLDTGKTWNFLRSNGSIPTASPMWGDFPWVVDSVKVSGVKVGVAGKHALLRVLQYGSTDPDMISTLSKPINITAP